MSKYFLFLFILLLGCESDKRMLQEIYSMNSFRKNHNLLLVDTLIYKDSSETYIRKQIGEYSYYDYIDKPNKNSVYYIATYYSSHNKHDSRKIIYTKHDRNLIKLAEETDIYRKSANDSMYAELIYKYDYEQNKKYLRIDSIPKDKLIIKRRRDLDSMANWAKNNGYQICGTAANEILEGNLPERHTNLDTNKIMHYISLFK